jgi:single stranded DNA-binding protein
MVNEVTLIGNAGRDAELRSSSSGAQYCTFTMATSERFKGHDGEWREDTEWHKIKVIGKSAERIASQVKKGDRLYVNGKISSYETDGITRVEIKSFRVLVLNGRKDEAQVTPGQFLPPSETSKRDPWRGDQSQEPNYQVWNPSQTQWR